MELSVCLVHLGDVDGDICYDLGGAWGLFFYVGEILLALPFSDEGNVFGSLVFFAILWGV